MNFVLNKSHLKKEIHPLMLPWGLAVIAGGLIGLKPLLEGSVFESLLVGLGWNVFLGGLALLATAAFGSELHERTLTLLLSQPSSRSRLWGEKMMILSLGIVTAVGAETALLWGMSNWYPGDDVWRTVHELLGNHGWALCGMFLLATVCSCTFWTLIAGSTIGGLVFTVTGQFVVTLAAAFAVSRFKGQEQLFQDADVFPVIIVAGLVYSVVLLYLGRRKFLRLEVRGSSVGRDSWALSTITWRVPLSFLLVSQPSSRVLNLIRKELRLQKSIFQLAGAFVLCWLAVLILQKVQPSQNITYFFDFLTCLYAPIASLLIGCLSLGEEKLLGTTASQLVLPFSSAFQWLIKLVVCAATAMVLSLALPLLLFWATGPVVNLSASGLMNHNDNGIQALAIISGLMFVLGYWGISLTTNTVRAAIVAIAGVITLPTCTVVGLRSAYLFRDFPQNGPTAEGLELSTTAAVAIVLLLGQSLIQFQRTEERKGKLLFYSIILVGLIFFVSFWSTCFG